MLKDLLRTNEDEIILSAILKKSREYLLSRPELKTNREQIKKYEQAKRRLSKGEPLAYVVGYRWFYNNKFSVNRSVLIPRPETEALVDLAKEHVLRKKPKLIVDVGTGSGAIIISLRKDFLKSKAEFLASDISSKALKVAKLNAMQLLTKSGAVKFHQGSLLSPMSQKLKNEDNMLIVANLPYLSEKELKEPSIKFEPRLALFGGKIDTDKIEALIKQVKKLGIKNSTILLEMNYNQGRKIKNLAKKYLPGSTTTVYKDLAGFDRIFEISF